MKFRDIPYKRPDVDAMIAKITALTEEFSAAENSEKQLEIFAEYEKEKGHFSTMSCISNIRNSIDSNDPFYIDEQAFYDSCTPKATQSFTSFERLCWKADLKQNSAGCLEITILTAWKTARKLSVPKLWI